MFLEFIATIFAGFAAAGVALILGKISGGRLPRWLMPVMAGLAMIGYTVWSEYTWFERTTATMPEGLVVVSQNESKALYRPWTYAFPLTDRFAALDEQSILTNESIPDQRLADMYFWGRWSPIQRVSVAFDCAQGRSAPIVEGVSMGEDGQIENASWSNVGLEDPALAAACGSA